MIKRILSNLSFVHRLSLAVFVVLLIQKLFVFYGFHTSFNDFYHKANATWNITQGNGLRIDLWGKSYFSNHFYPFYYIVALGYFIAPTAFWLLLFQVICQSVMTWGILQIAYDVFGKKGTWITLGLLFANYGFRRYNIEPLFGETVMAPLIAWILYFLIQSKDRWVLLLCFFMLFTKENAVAFLAPLGVFYVVIRHRVVIGLGLIAVSTFHAWYLIHIFIPSYNPVGYDFSSYFSYLSYSPKTVIKIILAKMLSSTTFSYLLGLLFPLGFMSLFSVYSVLGVGVILQNLLSMNQKLMIDLGYHVSQPLIPILFVGAIFGTKAWLDRKPHHRFLTVAKGFVYFGIFLNILLFIFLEIRLFYVDQSVWDAHRLLRQIPPKAAVSASRFYGAHLSHRHVFQRFPDYDLAEYILVETKSYYFYDDIPSNITVKKAFENHDVLHLIRALIFEAAPPEKIYYDTISALQSDPHYRVIGRGQSCLLFQRVKNNGNAN